MCSAPGTVLSGEPHKSQRFLWAHRWQNHGRVPAWHAWRTLSTTSSVQNRFPADTIMTSRKFFFETNGPGRMGDCSQWGVRCADQNHVEVRGDQPIPPK